jgi:hypothetical protein
MLGKRGPQRGLFEADTAYGEFVGRDNFYGWLAPRAVGAVLLPASTSPTTFRTATSRPGF